MVQLLFMAIVGAAIGWFTNYLAVKLIFRPQVPWRIPLTKMKIQGLIPKRRTEIAKSIGETVAKELITIEELLDKLIQSQNKQYLVNTLKNKVLLIVSQRLPGLIPGGIRKAILNYIDDILDAELEKFMDEALKDIVHKAAESIDIGAIVEEKINGFDLNQLESIILSISKRELKHIEYLGGVLGFVIGLFQGFIMLWWN